MTRAEADENIQKSRIIPGAPLTRANDRKKNTQIDINVSAILYTIASYTADPKSISHFHP